MEDIVPKLIENVTAEFHRLYDNSGTVQGLLAKIRQGTATYADAQKYALEVSRLIGLAYEKYVSSATLPDGRMYYNIASRLIPSTLDENYRLVADYAEAVQKGLNKKAGLGIKAQRAPYDEDRVDGLVELAASTEQYDEVGGKLTRAMETYSQSIVDESVRGNVNFQGKAGMTPVVYRRSTGRCCDWCRALVGKYDYPDVPRDVYRRHENCRCTVEYDPGEGRRQNVHNKLWTDQPKSVTMESKSKPAHRKFANGPRRGRLTVITSEEEQLIREYAKELGIPENILTFNTGDSTCFSDISGMIHIRGDIFPSSFAENPASILNARCALAHEYYGHYLHYPSKFRPGDWRDEFQASYFAAINTPNLTSEERRLLMIDAYERARNAGVTVELNPTARRMIHGI